MTDTTQLKASVVNYCSEIGKDPLLTQGAGGNASWKDADTLWIKASGTWLADAADKDIFVAVDLNHLNEAINKGDFSVTPIVTSDSPLRPSIEALLHALMPHRIVIHLHAIEVLAHLVREDCYDNYKSLIDDSTSWAMVDYHKPGTALASAVSQTLADSPNAKVVFLKNHGVVIGGTNVSEVNEILTKLNLALKTATIEPCRPQDTLSDSQSQSDEEFIPVPDTDVHQLALNSQLFERLCADWVLYPDHVVFLGPRPYTYDSWDAMNRAINSDTENANNAIDLVFIRGQGVFMKPEFNKAKQEQLRCYYDVLARQNTTSPLSRLSDSQIAELLNWDAEQYRMSLAQ